MVGWEGFWGLSVAIMTNFVMWFVPGSDYGSFQSFPYAIAQALKSPYLLGGIFTSVASIACFNVLGIVVLKRLNATAKAMIDACRTMFVFAFSLIFRWESLSLASILQIFGFAVLLLGTCTFNEVIKIPIYNNWYMKKKEEMEKILQ